MAHYLEADLQLWADALTEALFADGDGGLSTEHRASLWHPLDELAPLGDAVDTVLRASRLPLLQQLLRTPAEWQPAVLRNHTVAGALELSDADAAACSDAMPAVHGVHSLTLYGFSTNAKRAETDTQRLCRVVASMPTLHSFSATDCETHELAYLLAVAPALTSLPQLVCLDLRLRSVTQSEAAAVALALAGLPALTRLRLTSTGGSYDAGAQDFVPGLRCLSHLEYLDLSGWSRTKAAGTELLAPTLGLLTALTELNLRNHYCGDIGAEFLVPVLSKCVNLASLNLGWQELKLGGAEAIAPQLGRCPTLTRLDLSGNSLFDAGTMALAPALGHLSRLASLDLSFNDIGGDGAVALAPPLGRLTALTSLNLSGNELGATGATGLAPALSSLLQLMELGFGENDVGDAGAAALAAPLGGLTALTAVDLSCNEIGTAGIQELAPSLARLTALHELYLRGNQDDFENDEAVSRVLRAAVPACVWQAYR